MQGIGLDLGFGFVKVTDGVRGYSFSSAVGQGRPQPRFSVAGPRRPIDDLSIHHGGRDWLVGRRATLNDPGAMRSLTDDRLEQDVAMTLFRAALGLVDAHHQGSDYAIVTGLPPGWLDRVDALRERLVGEHEFESRIQGVRRTHRFLVADACVVPQAVGAYWSLVVGPDGALVPEAPTSGVVGVIDVGYRTTDLATLIDGEFVAERSRTIPLGISSVQEALSERIRIRFGVGLSTAELDSVMITGRLTLDGADHSVEEDRRACLLDLVRRISKEIASTWRLATYDRLFLAGGGASIVRALLEDEISRIEVVDEAPSANVRGYFAFGVREGLFELPFEQVQGVEVPGTPPGGHVP
jgi:plasmid segregation protein ParM